MFDIFKEAEKIIANHSPEAHTFDQCQVTLMRWADAAACKARRRDKFCSAFLHGETDWGMSNYVAVFTEFVRNAFCPCEPADCVA
jgi:hypothetical protein